MRSTNGSLLPLLLLIAFGLVPVAATEESPREEPEDQNLESRVFVLKHLGRRTAVTLLRSQFQVKRIAELPETNSVVITEDPRTVAAATRLIREVDVPPPRWQVELVLVSSSKPTVLRRLDIEDEKVTVGFAGIGSDHVDITLEAERPTVDTLTLDYRITANLPAGEGLPPFRFDESGEAALGRGDRIDVLRPVSDEHRRSLARLLGLPGQADELFLRFVRAG